MQLKTSLAVSAALDAMFTGLVVAALGLGWAAAHAPLPAAERGDLAGLHVLAGLAAGLFFVVEFIARGVMLTPLSAAGRSQLRRGFGYALRLLMNIGLFTMLASGALRAVYAGEHLQIWGAMLLFDVAPDANLAELFTLLHRSTAAILAAAIVARSLLGLVGLFTRPAPPLEEETVVAAREEPRDPTSVLARKLAKKLSLFGWIGFWTQLLIALLSTPLLIFGAMGRSINPGGPDLGDALSWGAASLLLLAVAAFLDFHDTRVSGRLLRDPEHYLRPENHAPFGFLGVASVVGGVGASLAFAGVGMSIGLLIAKTVSQPPGIAITDPNKIVRALDIFTLLLNFNLLFAHFLGAGIAVSLSMSALKARHGFIVANALEKAGVAPAPPPAGQSS